MKFTLISKQMMSVPWPKAPRRCGDAKIEKDSSRELS
jgi:hypothetical protein